MLSAFCAFVSSASLAKINARAFPGKSSNLVMTIPARLTRLRVAYRVVT